MKVLVSGGAGYIGSHTCVELLQAGYDIVVADNYYNASPEALRRVREITGRDFPAVEADMGEPAAVRNIFSAHPDIGAVIQFAAYKSVSESVRKPLAYYRNNLNTTMAVSYTHLAPPRRPATGRRRRNPVSAYPAKARPCPA